MNELNTNIKIVDNERKTHSKASEEYIHVNFNYPQQQKIWNGWVPVEYRRTGVSIDTNDELIEYLNDIYEEMKPDNVDKWYKEQKEFWVNKNAHTTQSFFNCLIKGGWKCVECDLPKNPNWARRVQDIKEFGYTIATDTRKYCENCAANKTHLILLPIKRGGQKGARYETWSPKLRKRILRVLEGIDVYEYKYNAHCLPDHKFSEIRWDDNTKAENPDDMTDEEIFSKFQLLTNQRNLQKREVCRTCYQTGLRGTIYGIPYYYEGTSEWDKRIPKTGKEAERGCRGCAWYDIAEWRKQLRKEIGL
ncbi:MAG: restriction endonuclease [Oscillospiraceae bacterium]|nr:restriction endonuclease [Oscillospiraceae bacterium]